MQKRYHLIHVRLKSKQNLKNIVTNFDNAMYQTVAICQKSSDFQE